MGEGRWGVPQNIMSSLCAVIDYGQTTLNLLNAYEPGKKKASKKKNKKKTLCCIRQDFSATLLTELFELEDAGLVTSTSQLCQYIGSRLATRKAAKRKCAVAKVALLSKYRC